MLGGGGEGHLRGVTSPLCGAQVFVDEGLLLDDAHLQVQHLSAEHAQAASLLLKLRQRLKKRRQTKTVPPLQDGKLRMDESRSRSNQTQNLLLKLKISLVSFQIHHDTVKELLVIIYNPIKMTRHR